MLSVYDKIDQDLGFQVNFTSSGKGSGSRQYPPKQYNGKARSSKPSRNFHQYVKCQDNNLSQRILDLKTSRNTSYFVKFVIN